MNLHRTTELLRRNEQWIPGGLASLNRRADPCLSFARGQGAYIWDYDDNRYIDYHFGFAPYLLGHNDPDVNEAVITALQQGRSNFGSGTTEEEGELAQLFLRCVPSAERVQFLNTGSEATAQALRVARAWTGRSHVIKIQGGYNGHHNMVAANLMTSAKDLGGHAVSGDEYPVVPITAGTPKEELALLHPVEFNDLAAVETVVRRHSIAAMITEPALQNIGVVPPQPGYLEGLRELADRYGFVLIFDEVKTGFRAHVGGYQALSGVTPDLSTFGKAIANGFPLSALAGKRDLMELAISDDPRRRVLLAGTYNSHPVPVAAAIATLRKLLDPSRDVYGHLERLGAQLQAGQEEIFERCGVPAVVSRIGSASCVYFMDKAPTHWWQLLTSHDFVRDQAYRRGLIERGIYHFPVPAKQGSISFAHTAEDIERTLDVTEAVASNLPQRRS